MFAGHVGAALAIGAVERRVNVGVFVAAALLLDLLLWSFVLLGWESVTIPPHFADTHQPDFIFPYSHGLLAGAIWSALAGGFAYFSRAPCQTAHRRVAALVAAAVFSHWLLDVIVHQPELPVAGAQSALLGLALWGNMPVALIVEAALLVVGLTVFVASSAWSRSRSVVLVVLSLVLLVFTLAGMTIAPAPPSAMAMAGSSLVTVVLVCALYCWLGWGPRDGQMVGGRW
jgi:hypothetical protein